MELSGRLSFCLTPPSARNWVYFTPPQKIKTQVATRGRTCHLEGERRKLFHKPQGARSTFRKCVQFQFLLVLLQQLDAWLAKSSSSSLLKSHVAEMKKELKKLDAFRL